MNEATPESLLRSALEKIVYFEARSTQLSNDLDGAKAEAERLKADLAHASQREIELRRLVAELEVRATRAHAEREETARLAEALRRERAELIGKMLDASRIQGAGRELPLDGFDLAQFISELRSEVLLQRDGGAVLVGAGGGAQPSPSDARAEGAAPAAAGAPATSTTAPSTATAGPGPRSTVPSHAAPAPADPAPRAQASDAASGGVTAVARALKAQGRLGVSAEQLSMLEGAKAFPGRSEETLFGFSVRELSALDVASRARAADRLKALAHPAAAPALAAALHAETEPVVLVALLGAIAALAKAEAVPVVSPHLTAPSPEVRIAALKALLTLDASRAAPHLAAAVKDPDKSVRRRASMLALGLAGRDALGLGTDAIRDTDADVRSLAALVLGASGHEAARTLLVTAMRDGELRVRRAASQALSRLLGTDVTALVGLDDAQRRREVRRLSQVEARPVQATTAHISARLRALEPELRPAAPAGEGKPVHAEARSAAPTVTAAASPSAPAPSLAPVAPAPAPVAAVAPRTPVRALVSSAAQHAAAPSAARTAVAELDAAPAPVSDTLCDALEAQLRAAIRGRTLDELSRDAGVPQADALRACGVLLERGRLVRRGLKYFAA